MNDFLFVAQQHVKGYSRSNGHYVRPYTRSLPGGSDLGGVGALIVLVVVVVFLLVLLIQYLDAQGKEEELRVEFEASRVREREAQRVAREAYLVAEERRKKAAQAEAAREEEFRLSPVYGVRCYRCKAPVVWSTCVNTTKFCLDCCRKSRLGPFTNPPRYLKNRYLPVGTLVEIGAGVKVSVTATVTRDLPPSLYLLSHDKKLASYFLYPFPLTEKGNVEVEKRLFIHDNIDAKKIKVVGQEIGHPQALRYSVKLPVD